MNYENLPVYKATFDLLIYVYRYTVKIQREYRYTLAEEMKRTLQEVLMEIYRANIVRDKADHISRARQELVRVRVHFRLMRELKLLSLKQCVMITESIADISKQLTAWEKHVTSVTKLPHDANVR
ncbi:four helix bundle protein [Porphyromonas pogonae]|uniref:four helix bundle protein n=1 Tax=Porphyromonas pogonae TaxID=867595 RepID=UPI002E784F7B|nr:four helix bundle protein [Porphyromonas pogonae]